ncbi:MAG: metalloregulator ArsR/SmtB family transcription factor [Nitriliruptoraceae bacterium]
MDQAPTTVDEGLREEIAQLTSSMCQALNDPKRILIMYVLADGRMTVSDLCTVVGASQSNVSQHLAVLRERGLVTAEREGSNVRYSLRHPRVLEAIDILRGIQSDEFARRQGLVAN